MSEAMVVRPARVRLATRLMVLVVEQRAEVREELAEILAGQPITVASCDDVARALLTLGRTNPDVVLVGPVDGRLGATDFITIARADDPGLPIVAGAGPEAPEFAAHAAAAGATAVIPRPYRAMELLALLSSLARPDHVPIRPPLELGRLRIDGALPQCWVDGRQVALPQMEYELLRHFASRVGQVVSRAELIEALWGDGEAPSSNTLTVHVMRLRKRLADLADAEWIRAVRGHGYLFGVPAA